MVINFVFARYKENFAKDNFKSLITKKINDPTIQSEIFIYDKFSSRNDTHKLVQNVGREHYAWFSHIIETWENPPDYYFFAHPCGPENDQRPEKFKFLVKIIDDIPNMILSNKDYSRGNDKDYKNRDGFDTNFCLKGGWIGSTKSNIEDVRKQKYAVTNYKNMGEWWIKTTGINKFPIHRSTYGMCITSSKNIQSWGLEFWERLLDQVVQGGVNCEIAHFLERSMYRFAQGKLKMKKINFVFARYKENITKNVITNNITKKINDPTIQSEIFIYDKFSSRNDTHKLVQNVGREHYAWFSHIIETWENPPDYYGFIHPCGPENDQRPEKFKFLVKIIDDFMNVDNSIEFRIPSKNYSKKNGWIGGSKSNIEDVSKQNYVPTNYKNMGEWWNNIIGVVDFPKQSTTYGMCITSSKNIQSWGLEFWERLLDQIVMGGANCEIAHFLERSMYRFAQGKLCIDYTINE